MYLSDFDFPWHCASSS